MTSVGMILRTERERQGRGVAEIAEELCITRRYLLAIEQDDLKTLPGSFFYKSFVKQYAAIVGVQDSTLEPGVQALTAALEPLPLPGAKTGQSPGMTAANTDHFLTGMNRPPVRDLDPIVRDSNRHYFPDRRMGISIAGLVGMLLACSVVYAWWTQPKAQAAPRIVAAATNPVEIPAATPEPAVNTATPTSTGTDAEPAVEVAAQNVKVTATTATGTDGVNRVALNLSATEKTWLSISSAGKEIFSGVLEPSQTKTLTGLEAAKLKVGNAAGLDVRWNGKPIGPIGPRGQVRVILFTPDNFQILSPNQAL